MGIDGEVAKTLHKILAKQGMKFKLETKVMSVKKEGSTVKVEVEAAKGGNKEVVRFIITSFFLGLCTLKKSTGNNQQLIYRCFNSTLILFYFYA